jgi:AcrR family transcriptional regulator
MTSVYSSGDPDRSLPLLWGTPEPPTRGPKPALTVERIVRAAIDLADGDGLGALSMRRIAERLGVGTMSLYTYVPGKGELIDLMVDSVVGERGAAGSPGASGASGPAPGAGASEAPPSGWRASLERLAREGLAGYQRHPWLLQLAWNRPPLGPNVLDDEEATLAALSGSGLEPRELVAAATLVSNYTQGAARAVVDAALAEKRTGVSEEQFWAARMKFWEVYFDPERYPRISEMYAAGAYDDEVDAFEFGLQRVLDGIEALVRAQGAGPTPAAGTSRGSS